MPFFSKKVEVTEHTNEPELVIHNTYSTSILPHIDDTKKPKPKTRSNAIIQILNDNNANERGDITHLGWIPRMDYSVQEIEREKLKQAAVDQHRQFMRDPNRLLEVLITTVMLAAAEKPVPKEHLIYSLIYLKNIRDEYGDHPPNISNFIKYLNHLNQQQKVEWKQSFHVDPDKKTHITKIQNASKLSRIPRPITKKSFEDDESLSLKRECKRLDETLRKKGCVDFRLNNVE